MVKKALYYLGLGWSVYPAHTIQNGLCTCGRDTCPSPGKHPMGGWLPFQKRLPTEKEVVGWFSLSCNIGVVTGKISGLAIIDIDSPEGESEINQLGLPSTLTALTGGGGKHLFYKYSDTFPTRSKLFTGVDVRGEAGYAILPPSRHNSGNRYRWLVKKPPVDLPLALLQPYLAKSKDNPSGWVDHLLEGVAEGERSQTAVKLAGRYYNLGLTPGEVWTLMEAWNLKNVPPLLISELWRTVEWVRRKHSESTLEMLPIINLRNQLVKG